MSSPSLQDELALLIQEKQRLLAENQLLKEEVAELKRLIYGHGGAGAKESALCLPKKMMLNSAWNWKQKLLMKNRP